MDAFPEQTHQFYEAKGMFVLAFENTTKSDPGTVNIDAAMVANVGYFASENSRVFSLQMQISHFLIQVTAKVVPILS